MRSIFLSALLIATIAANAETVVREWRPEEIAKWSGGNVKNLRVADGVLQFETQKGDSMLISPPFEAFPASASQILELTMQSEVAGRGQIFWTNTTKTQFGGFAPGKITAIEIEPGLKTYRIEPFWQAEQKIVRMRLDFPEEHAARYTIKSIRVVEQATQAAVSLPARDLVLDAKGQWRGRVSWQAENGAFLCLRMAASAGQGGVISFASRKENGLHRVSFPIRADGRMHTYNVDVGGDKHWRGEIVELRLQPTLSADPNVRVESLALGAEPQGPVDLEITYLGLCDPVARVGRPLRLEARVINHGGEPARDISPQLSLKGAKIIGALATPEKVEAGEPETLAWEVEAKRPGQMTASLALEGAAPKAATLPLLPQLRLPKVSYVPEPKPAKTDYPVGVYYFPGWHTASRWAPLRSYPERQPLLGYYREGDPEVADWQIKWAVEHGINFFIYDWYWDRGGRHLEHGLHDALFKARYQNLIKFCLLYANHNSPGSHSAADFEQIARFWIDNYFKRSNYLTVEGKPVVVMFAPMNPMRDMGGAAPVRAAFDRMRAMCREAGLPGLYFVACTPPTTNLLPNLQAMGYDAVSTYNWPSINMTPAETTARRAPFVTCIEGFREAWAKIADAGVLKLIPPVCGGWDARPWHGEGTLVRTGRTPELFKRHLQDCKEFLDRREQDPKLKMLFVEAWNEWGEGSYIEPHREFGFGYLEAIRQVFAPGSRKPSLALPADIGLGPYDLEDQPAVTAWDFTKAKDCLGWSGSVNDLRIEQGALHFKTRGRDPVLSSPTMRARASLFSAVTLRVKASRNIEGQLFWSTTSSPASEASSVHFPIRGDGKFQEIKLNVADNPRWRGVIKSLRFDPGSVDGVDAAIESIGLVSR